MAPLNVWIAESGLQLQMELADLERLLEPEDLLDFGRLPTLHARRRFAVGRILLRHALSSVTGDPPGSWRYERTARGKLGVIGGRVELSVSYSNDLVALAFAPSAYGRVGIDLEYCDRSQIESPGLEHTLEDYFEKDDLLRLQTVPKDLRWKETYRIWTQKEAHSKLLGIGLMDDFCRLNSRRQGIHFEQLEVLVRGRVYALAIASEAKKFKPAEIVRIDAGRLKRLADGEDQSRSTFRRLEP